MSILWSTARVIMLIAVCIGNASAGWVLIKPNPQNAAINPGYLQDQGARTVAAYVQDLLGLENPPVLIAWDNRYTGAPLTGLGNPVPSSMYVLAFHFGGGNDYRPYNEAFIVYSCTSECDHFTLPSTRAVRSYRLFDPPRPRVANVTATISTSRSDTARTK